MRLLLLFSLSFSLLCTCCSSSSTDLVSGFAARQLRYIGQEVNKTVGGAGGNGMCVAKSGSFLSNATIIDLLSRTSDSRYFFGGILERETSDFAIIEILRMDILTNYSFTEIFRPLVEAIPFWMNVGEDLRVYWSENHMIMWASVALLMNEHYGTPLPDPNFRKRIVKLLEIKRDFGYYEFFSTTYLRFSFGGLANIAEFSFDPELRLLATQAIDRMVRDLVLMTNSKGGWFPISGRSKNSHYVNPQGQAYTAMIGVLTGLGTFPDFGSNGAAFLATTDVNITDALATYTEDVNMTIDIGITLEQQDQVYANQDYFDKTVFQWSQGGYFHYESQIAENTFATIKHFDMWRSKYFKDYAPFSWLPSPAANDIAFVLQGLSPSSLLNGQAVVFKHKNIMMTSMQDYFGGHKGYQQHPFMSTTGNLVAFPQSGPPIVDWTDRSSNTLNYAFPSVKQVGNVAVLAYNSHPDLPILGYAPEATNLWWPENDFDETMELGNWLLGREDDGYVAVYRPCRDFAKGFPSCSAQKQVWVVVMGHQDLHGTFEDFSKVIGNATVAVEDSGQCVRGLVSVDDKAVRGFELCQPLLGPIGVIILTVSLYLVLQCCCCFVCCRKKRRVWKQCVSRSSETRVKAMSKLKGRPQSDAKTITLNSSEMETMAPTTGAVRNPVYSG